MKVVEYEYEGSDWGYIELNDGTLVQLPKDAIEELEAEQKQIKADLEKARSYKHVIKMNNRNLTTANERLKKEIAKLKCLALHLLREYCFAQGTIIHTELELTEPPIEEDMKMIHKINIRDRWGEYFAEAYRKAKKELRERK